MISCFLLLMISIAGALKASSGEAGNVSLVDIYQSLGDLKRQVSELQAENANLKQRSMQLEIENTNFKQRFSTLETSFRKQSGAGFTATTLLRKGYSDGETIVFESEVYDGNNNYDPATGIYTCPVSGMYLFSFEIFGAEDFGSTYCLTVGSDDLSCSYSYNNVDGTASLVINCAQNTPVSVTARVSGAATYGAFFDLPLASFSGVLISIDA